MNIFKIVACTAVFLGCSVANAKEIRVLATQSMPQCGSVNGQPVGMAVDILKAITADGGPTFKFDFSLPWARALVEVHADTNAAIIPLTRTAEREPNFKWIGDLFDSSGRLVTVGRAQPIQSVDEAKGLTIGIMRGSSFEGVLKQDGLAHLDVLQNDELIAKMLQAGHVDAWAANEDVERYLFAKTGGDVSKLQGGPLLGKPGQIYIAADPKFPAEDAKAIADGLEKLRASGKLAEIIKKYRQ